MYFEIFIPIKIIVMEKKFYERFIIKKRFESK